MALKAPEPLPDKPVGSECWELWVKPHIRKTIEHSAQSEGLPVGEWLDREMTWRTLCPFYIDLSHSAPVQEGAERCGEPAPMLDFEAISRSANAAIATLVEGEALDTDLLAPEERWELWVTPQVRDRLERSAQSERLPVGEWLSSEMALRFFFPPTIHRIYDEQGPWEKEANWHRWELRVSPRARETIERSAQSEGLPVSKWLSRELMFAGNKARLMHLARELAGIMRTGESKADALINAALEVLKGTDVD